ncbi:hypothetical protein ACFOLF_13505 [Paenibacillus sepulcri]|uniref:DUF4868 domain-containing protein n=1 Tax=Paenibacillus sepulcri TaxID=359917 RepID=A0ABS7BW48_9BACL|nr:hypothetical protein [Paenibacillus sepulcri]
MKLNSRHFPHPVLYHLNDNFTESEFIAVMESVSSSGAGSYSFKIHFSTNNDELRALVSSQQAFYAAHFECSETRYRNMLTTTDEQFTVDIPGDFVNGRVVIRFFILANATMDHYSNTNFHTDYEGFSFKVIKGDILAIALEKEFHAIKKIQPVGHISSIFQVIRNDDRKAPALDYLYSEDKIVIRLSRENFDNYNGMRRAGGYEYVLAALIITPVLSSLLEKIKNSYGDFVLYEDKRWYKSLKARMKAKNYDMSKLEEYEKGVVAIAQELIGDPLTLSLSRLLATETTSEEGEVTA